VAGLAVDFEDNSCYAVWAGWEVRDKKEERRDKN
jgi:hypothetical protein